MNSCGDYDESALKVNNENFRLLLAWLSEMKNTDVYDARSIAVSITHVETALMWADMAIRLQK